MNLTTRSWCDIVFEGRNKDFGAYPLRMESGRRHMTALLLVAPVFVGIIVFVLVTNMFDYSPKVHYTQVRDISMLKPAENKKNLKNKVPPRPLRGNNDKKTILETAPVIQQDELVAPEPDAPAQEGSVDGIALVNYADTTALDTAATLRNAVNANDRPEDFQAIAQLPEYPGGMVAFMKWLTDNLKYPKQGSNNDGRVVVQFIIMKDGSISELKIIHSLNARCDNEVLRVFRMMPKWKPGTENGKPIQTQMVLPINFRSS